MGPPPQPPQRALRTRGVRVAALYGVWPLAGSARIIRRHVSATKLAGCAGWFRRDRAQAAIEFLLILPFFIGIVLLAIDFGLMMYDYVSISNAVSEGARYAAVNCETGTCTAAEVQQRTVDRSGGILSSSDTSEVTVGWRDVNGISADGSTGKGDSVVVKVDHPYNFLFFPVTIDVKSCADYRLEQQDSGSGLPSGSAC